MTFICYPKCSTCKKARAWLESQGFSFTERDIKSQPPTQKELREWHRRSGLPLKKFFNTSGQRYRVLNVKARLSSDSHEELVALLASDGMLIKRPLLVTDNRVLVGFNAQQWEEALSGLSR